MFTYIQVAHIVLECDTALAIGSGKSSAASDNHVKLDYNDLPVIPWSSINGVLNHLAEEDKIVSSLLGEEIRNKETKEKSHKGSQLIGSDAYLLNSKYEVHQELSTEDIFEDELLKYYEILPVREHTSINAFGSAKEKSKYSNSIVYKGSRFKLEVKLELQEKPKGDNPFDKILSYFKHPMFRLGAQTTNGLGKMEVISCQTKVFDLKNKNNLKSFFEYTPNLNNPLNGVDWGGAAGTIVKDDLYTDHSFKFKSEAIHIGSGYGDLDTDHANLKEYVITWDENNKPKAALNFVVPGASVKGTLYHRSFYYWCPPLDIRRIPEDESDTALGNHYEKQFEIWKPINPFGFENNATSKDATTDETGGAMGQIIIEDVYIPFDEGKETLFNHNKIDRFTQGTITGALYSEKVFAIEEAYLSIKYLKRVYEEPEREKGESDDDYSKRSEKYINQNKSYKSFKTALDDLTTGLLPVGGNTTNGNGFLKVIEEKKTA